MAGEVAARTSRRQRAAAGSELLRNARPPRERQNIDLLVPKLVEQLRAQPRQRPWPIRDPGRRRAANSRYIEHDCLAALERRKEGHDQFEVRADAIEDQQRRLGITMADADAQHLPATSCKATCTYFSIT
jgi:hypothetical protein